MEGVLVIKGSAAAATAVEPALLGAQLERALRLALRLTPDRALAEDAVQQAFLETWRRRARIAPEAFWSYLLTSLTRLIWRLGRQQRRLVLDEQRVTEQPDHAHTAPEALAAAQEQAAVRAAIAALPRRRRQVVELRLAGLSADEVGAALGMAPATVRVTFHHALAALRERLPGGTR